MRGSIWGLSVEAALPDHISLQTMMQISMLIKSRAKMWRAMWSVCFHSYLMLPSQIRLNLKMDVWLSTVFACRARMPLRGIALYIYDLALLQRALNKKDWVLLPWRWRGQSSLPSFPRLHPSFLSQSFLLRGVRDFSGREIITFPVTLLYFQILTTKKIETKLDARGEAPAMLVGNRGSLNSHSSGWD